MTLSDALALFDYWSESPPEHELLAMAMRVYTTWEPASAKAVSHQESLERRWKAGAMNVKQMFESLGGSLKVTQDQGGGPRMTGADLPGIGRFPGAPADG